MLEKMNRRVRRSIEKNGPELRAFLSGQIPSFVAHRGKSTPGEVPVFLFHDVEPEQFEAQLFYLRSNGYRTLDADELEAVTRGDMKREGCEVSLTFDDATWTFWVYAFPLLKKYGFQAILFAIPGIVPEDATLYPNLEDIWEGRCVRVDVDKCGRIQPLCTWRELAVMHASGIVDIQSHSLTHARVPVSSQLEDFLHPGFDTYISNLSIPISSLDKLESPERKLRLGAPVFKSTPRLAGRLRFKEAPALIEAMTVYVEKHGGSAFFDHPSWRKELTTFFRRWPVEKLGGFETSEEMQTAMYREFVESRKILEERLGTKRGWHFCYPWHAGSNMADRLATEAGYRTLHYGPYLGKQKVQTTGGLLRIRRILEEYIFRLPGDGRLPLRSIWLNRVRRAVKRRIV